jgi:hypothetical protein
VYRRAQKIFRNRSAKCCEPGRRGIRSAACLVLSWIPPRRTVLRPPLDPELRQILGPPPLFEGESEADYNQLYDRFRSAVSPKDVIEEMWVRDLADLGWETNRLRRLKAKLMDAARWQGMAVVLENLGSYTHEAKKDASAYAAGDSRAKAKVDQIFEKAKIDRGMIEAQTLAARISDFERIDRLMMWSESRRNAVLP